MYENWAKLMSSNALNGLLRVQKIVQYDQSARHCIKIYILLPILNLTNFDFQMELKNIQNLYTENNILLTSGKSNICTKILKELLKLVKLVIFLLIKQNQNRHLLQKNILFFGKVRLGNVAASKFRQVFPRILIRVCQCVHLCMFYPIYGHLCVHPCT